MKWPSDYIFWNSDRPFSFMCDCERFNSMRVQDFVDLHFLIEVQDFVDLHAVFWGLGRGINVSDAIQRRRRAATKRFKCATRRQNSPVKSRHKGDAMVPSAPIRHFPPDTYSRCSFEVLRRGFTGIHHGLYR